MNIYLIIISIIFGLLIFSCLISIFKRQWMDFNKAFFQLLMSPLSIAEVSLKAFWAGVKSFYHHHFEDHNSKLNLPVAFYRFIGACLYSATFFLFVFADFHVLLMTLEAMGIEPSHAEPLFGYGKLTALSLIASILFFGTIMLDLIGMTEIAPWQNNISEKWKQIILGLTIFALSLSLLITSLAGLYRGSSLIETGDGFSSGVPKDYLLQNQYLSDSNMELLATQDHDIPVKKSSKIDWIPIFVNTSIPVLLLIGGCLGGWGPVELFRLLMLAVIFLFFCPVGILLIAFAYSSRIIDRIFGLTLTLFDLLATFGQWLLGLFNYHPPYGISESPSNENNSDPKEEDNKSTVDDHDDDHKNGFNPYE